MAGELEKKFGTGVYWIIIVLEALLFLFLIGSTNKCSSDKIDLLENNIAAYQDSLRTETLKNGDILASKQSLIIEKEAAQQALDISKSEYKELEKKLDSKLALISKLSSQLEYKDTVYMKGDTVYIDNDITHKRFKWADNWTSLTAEVNGKTILDSELSIYDFKVDVPLEFGITDDYRVWAKSTNPNVNIQDISSATIYGSTAYPKKKWLYHGINVGFGVNYGLINKTLDIGPSVSYGLTIVF